MPKICKRFFQINSEHVPVDIFYNQKKLFFAVGVPDKVIKVSDKRFSHFKDEESLNREIEDALNLYHQKIRKSRKVIAYSLTMTTDLCMKKTAEGSWEGYKDWVPDTLKTRSERFFGDTDGYGFSIDWEVLMEIRDKKTIYHTVHEDGSIGFQTDPHGSQLIDWTSEREDAFRQIENSLEEMVKKISIVLGDSQKMIGMIESKEKLLEFK